MFVKLEGARSYHVSAETMDQYFELNDFYQKKRSLKQSGRDIFRGHQRVSPLFPVPYCFHLKTLATALWWRWPLAQFNWWHFDRVCFLMERSFLLNLLFPLNVICRLIPWVQHNVVFVISGSLQFIFKNIFNPVYLCFLIETLKFIYN